MPGRGWIRRATSLEPPFLVAYSPNLVEGKFSEVQQALAALRQMPSLRRGVVWLFAYDGLLFHQLAQPFLRGGSMPCSRSSSAIRRLRSSNSSYSAGIPHSSRRFSMAGLHRGQYDRAITLNLNHTDSALNTPSLCRFHNPS